MKTLFHERDAVFAESAIGIFQIRRELGQSVLDAYKEVLLAIVGQPPEVIAKQLQRKELS